VFNEPDPTYAESITRAATDRSRGGRRAGVDRVITAVQRGCTATRRVSRSTRQGDRAGLRTTTPRRSSPDETYCRFVRGDVRHRVTRCSASGPVRPRARDGAVGHLITGRDEACRSHCRRRPASSASSSTWRTWRRASSGSLKPAAKNRIYTSTAARGAFTSSRSRRPERRRR